MSEVAIVLAKHGNRRDDPGLKDALYLPLNKLADEIERCFFDFLLIPLPKSPKQSTNTGNDATMGHSMGHTPSSSLRVPPSSSPSHPYNFFVFWDLLERCEFRADCPHIR